MLTLVTLWIARTIGLDKMEKQRRDNDRLVLEIEAQQQEDELEDLKSGRSFAEQLQPSNTNANASIRPGMARR